MLDVSHPDVHIFRSQAHLDFPTTDLISEPLKVLLLLYKRMTLCQYSRLS
jgi:hypothetical protein